MNVIVSLDGALGDTRPLWDDWLAGAAGVVGVDPTDLPRDRGAAAAILDERGGNWRVLLERFAEDRAPVYLRPATDASAALRRLEAAGARIVVVTDAPRELAEIAAAHLGLMRRIESLECGANAGADAVTLLGEDARLVTTRAELVALAAGL